MEQRRLIKDDYEVAPSCVRAPVVSKPWRGVVHRVARWRERARGRRRAIEGAMRAAGYERPAFDTIVASGPNAALPHHRAGARILAKATSSCWTSAASWTDTAATSPGRRMSGVRSPDASKSYDAVREAHQAAIAAVRPGSRRRRWTPRRVGADGHGLGEAFGHGTGHGLGSKCTKNLGSGAARGRARVPLEPGMVFTIEPGAYLSRVGAVSESRTTCW